MDVRNPWAVSHGNCDNGGSDEPIEKSEQIFGDHGMLFTARKRLGLLDDKVCVCLEAIAVAVRADVNFGRDNRVTSHADFILRRITDDTARTLGAIENCRVFLRYHKTSLSKSGDFRKNESEFSYFS